MPGVPVACITCSQWTVKKEAKPGAVRCPQNGLWRSSAQAQTIVAGSVAGLADGEKRPPLRYPR